ncbi:MAG: hypothetical protein WBM04_17500 [Candidatus Korobacteraceae bacterium]
MKTGDTVRLIGVPADVPEGDAALPTRQRFEQCVGHVFVIAGFNEIGMAELIIESVTGSVGETIWVEPNFLELLSK